jgi:hypothetical protein
MQPQTGGSQVRFLTSLFTEMTTKNFRGNKENLAAKADVLTLSVSQFSEKCGKLDVSQLYRHPQSVTRIVLPFYLCGDPSR